LIEKSGLIERINSFYEKVGMPQIQAKMSHAQLATLDFGGDGRKFELDIKDILLNPELQKNIEIAAGRHYQTIYGDGKVPRVEINNHGIDKNINPEGDESHAKLQSLMELLSATEAMKLESKALSDTYRKEVTTFMTAHPSILGGDGDKIKQQGLVLGKKRSVSMSEDVREHLKSSLYEQAPEVLEEITEKDIDYNALMGFTLQLLEENNKKNPKHLDISPNDFTVDKVDDNKLERACRDNGIEIPEEAYKEDMTIAVTRAKKGLEAEHMQGLRAMAEDVTGDFVNEVISHNRLEQTEANENTVSNGP
jgi:hypothetical protein